MTSTATMATRLSAFSPDVWTAAISAFLHLVEVFHVDVGDRQDHDQHDVGERARTPCLPFLESHLVEPDRYHLGGRLAGQNVGEVEGLERLHGAEDDGDHQDRRDQRQRYAE